MWVLQPTHALCASRVSKALFLLCLLPAGIVEVFRGLVEHHCHIAHIEESFSSIPLRGMIGPHGSERRRSSSASVAAKRLSHPTSLVAFTKRIESVVNRGKVLTPQETQKFRNANLCDFERLAVPRVRQPTATEREEIRALRCFAPQRDNPSRNDSTFTGDSQLFRSPSPFCSPSPLLRHSERPPTPLEVQRWREERRSKLEIAVQWPPTSAGCKLAERDRRLSPNCLSSTLRRAVYGQSLDRILERHEERMEQEDLLRAHGSPDGGDGRGEEDARRVAVNDGADSFSPTAAKRNKNNNLFLMAAHEHATARQQGEEVQMVEVGGSHAGAAVSQDLGTYLTNLSDPAFRKTLTTVAPQAYALVRKLFQELDDKHEGVVELAKALQFHNKYPKRLGRDILDNLRVELDGRIYLDELVRVHFPSVPQDSIEQLIELLEPKVQSIDAVSPHTMHQLEVLYLQIVAKYSHATFAWWLASRKSSTGTGTCGAGDPSPRAGATECSTARPDSSTGLRASDAAEGSVDDDGRASTTSRSDAGTHITTGRRPSLPTSSSGVSTNATAPIAVMNAMQLLMHLQHTANFTAKELTQLYRLKHIPLRPAYNLALSRAMRRANATTAAASHRGSIYGGLGRSTTSPPPNSAGAPTAAVVVCDPSTNVPIPLALLQAPHTPSGEPSLPYLTNCVVRFQDFVVLLMEYYVMKQSDAYVEPYDPNLRAYLDRIHWDKLFPYTGPVKHYFDRLPS